MDYLADSIPLLMGAASAAVPLLQSQKHHQKEMTVAIDLHKQAIAQAAEHHEQSKDISFRLHQEGLIRELEQHIESVKLTIEAARRENLRDVWSQKSRRAETVLIIASLMIGGLFALLVEGIPPSTVWEGLLITYGILLALSLSFLFSCIWFTMKYQTRMTDYNIYKPKQIYTCGERHESFESYYNCHCSIPARIANWCFYIGTMLLLVSAGLFVFARFYIDFSSVAAAASHLSIVLATVVLLIVFQFVIPTKTRMPDLQHEDAGDAKDAEDDAKEMEMGKLGEGGGGIASHNLEKTQSQIPQVRRRQLKKDATTFGSYFKDLSEGVRKAEMQRSESSGQVHKGKEEQKELRQTTWLSRNVSELNDNAEKYSMFNSRKFPSRIEKKSGDNDNDNNNNSQSDVEMDEMDNDMSHILSQGTRMNLFATQRGGDVNLSSAVRKRGNTSKANVSHFQFPKDINLDVGEFSSDEEEML